MSEQLTEIKPFKQVPSCDADAILSITGTEFEAIQNFLNVFKTPLVAVESIFQRNLNEGKIVMKYIQEDGTEISQEQATEYLEKIREFLKEKDKNPLTEA